MQLTLLTPSPNSHWDAIQGKPGWKIATKQHLPSGQLWVFNYFRQKLAGEKISLTEKFGPGQLRQDQSS